MGEALAHGARLDARLERQGLARDTQFLVARRILIGHSVVLIQFAKVRSPHCRCNCRYFECLVGVPAALWASAIRYRTSVWQRDRNVLPAGPASSAACITFD